jgi:methyl-accepting chemotaxis protein
MFSSIRSRVLAACVAIVIASLLVNAALNYFVVNADVNESINSNLIALANGHNSGIGEWVASKTTAITSLEDLALGDADPVPTFRRITAAGGFLAAYAGYPDKVFKTTLADGLPPGYDPTARPWYKRAESAGKPVVTAPYIDAATGKLVVTIAVPVMRDGALKAVLGGDIEMNSVIENVKAIHPTPKSFGVLVDGAGDIVAHPDASLTLKPISTLMPTMSAASIASLAGASEPLKASANGRTVLLRGVAVPGTDWTIIVALDEAEARAGVGSMLTSSAIALVLIVLVATAIVSTITSRAFRRLSHVRDAMDAIGSGTSDLSQRLPVHGSDEVTQIAGSFNAFVEKLQHVMLQIRDASESVRQSAGEIAAGNHDLSARTESAAASLEQTAASMAEITTTVSHSANSARAANDLTSSASVVASRGGDVVSEVVSTMATVESDSGKIGDIIGVIDGIAFQTNILALNAAVEAARAGEAGRSFAVVAGEVRTLAQRCAASAKEIKDVVNASVNEVAQGTELVSRTTAQMRAIDEAVSRVSTIIVEVANASGEQAEGIRQVNQAVTSLDNATQQNAALVEQAAATAQHLVAQADILEEAVRLFTVGGERS